MAKIITLHAFFNVVTSASNPCRPFLTLFQNQTIYRENQKCRDIQEQNRQLLLFLLKVFSFHTDYGQYENHYLGKESY